MKKILLLVFVLVALSFGFVKGPTNLSTRMSLGGAGSPLVYQNLRDSSSTLLRDSSSTQLRSW